jgi:hypothetical protein
VDVSIVNDHALKYASMAASSADPDAENCTQVADIDRKFSIAPMLDGTE